jgi:hypothetical protein
VQPAHVLTHTPESSEVASDDVPGGNVALIVIAGAWIVIAVRYLSHRIVLSSDSMNNYVHVWWVARDLWHHGRLPWHMPVLGHGAAYAYPYGFTNWTAGALLWPVFGNQMSCTRSAPLRIVAMFLAFRACRVWGLPRCEPAIIQALLFGQQAFAWAPLLLFGIAVWHATVRSSPRSWWAGYDDAAIVCRSACCWSIGCWFVPTGAVPAVVRVSLLITIPAIAPVRLLRLRRRDRDRIVNFHLDAGAAGPDHRVPARSSGRQNMHARRIAARRLTCDQRRPVAADERRLPVGGPARRTPPFGASPPPA